MVESRRLPQLLLLVLIMLAASSIVPGIPAAAQDVGLGNSCAPELLESVPGPEYQCGPGPQGQGVLNWRMSYATEDNPFNVATNFVEYQDTIVFGDSGGFLRSLNKHDGSTNWIIEVPQPEGSLVSDGESIYWLNRSPWRNDQQVHAHSLQDGNHLWSSNFDYGTWDLRDLAVADAHVIVSAEFWTPPSSDDHYRIFAMNASDGRLSWEVEVSEQVIDVALTDTQLFVSVGSTVHVMDLTTRNELWRVDVPGAAHELVVYDQMLYVRTGDGNLFEFDLAAFGQERNFVQGPCRGGIRVLDDGIDCFPGTWISTARGEWWNYVDPSIKVYDPVISDWKPFITIDEDPRELLVTDGFLFVRTEEGSIVSIGGNEGEHAIGERTLDPGEGIEVGATVQIMGEDTVLRGAPSPSSVEILALAEGTSVRIVDGPLEENGDTWWQVTEPESGNTGYVPADNLVTNLE